ncbi:hypothetical protein D3C86_1102350 [compost metagenome]
MDHVRGGDQQANGLADRHDHRLVGGQAIEVSRRLVLGRHVRDVLGHALVGIFIGPVPLVAGDLHRQIGVRHVVVGEQQAEREERDADQDQHRHHGPDDLDDRVVAPLGRNRVGLLVVADGDPDQQAQHQQGDDRDDGHQHPVMEEDRLVLQRRCGGLQVDSARGRLPQQILRPCRRGDEGGKGGRGDTASDPRHGSRAHPHSSPHKPFRSRYLRAIRKHPRALDGPRRFRAGPYRLG